MAVALVLGCNGQDGTFLCRRLLKQGHAVIGVGKQAQPRFAYPGQPFSYAGMDLALGTAQLEQLLSERRPERVFHVAAVHASASSASYEPIFRQMLAVNVASLHAVLEYARVRAPEARILYASSAKVFGAPLPAHIDEDTPRASPCLYSVSKNAAGDLLRYYRGAHGCRASQLYLFNHESELRPASFFIPKVVRILAGAAVAGAACSAAEERFATLDFHCDWGSADEYMELAIDCLERAPGEDFVLATGRCLHARELVARLAAEYGCTLPSVVDRAPSPGGGQPSYQVNIAKLVARVGRAPQRQIEAVIRELVERARGA